MPTSNTGISTAEVRDRRIEASSKRIIKMEADLSTAEGKVTSLREALANERAQVEWLRAMPVQPEQMATPPPPADSEIHEESEINA